MSLLCTSITEHFSQLKIGNTILTLNDNSIVRPNPSESETDDQENIALLKVFTGRYGNRADVACLKVSFENDDLKKRKFKIRFRVSPEQTDEFLIGESLESEKELIATCKNNEVVGVKLLELTQRIFDQLKNSRFESIKLGDNTLPIRVIEKLISERFVNHLQLSYDFPSVDGVELSNIFEKTAIGTAFLNLTVQGLDMKKISSKTERLRISTGKFEREQLLSSDVEVLAVYGFNQLCSEDVNAFLRNWLNGGTPRAKHFIIIDALRKFRPEKVLEGLPFHFWDKDQRENVFLSHQEFSDDPFSCNFLNLVNSFDLTRKSWIAFTIFSLKEIIQYETLGWQISLFVSGCVVLYRHVLRESCDECSVLILEISFLIIPLLISFIHPLYLIWYVLPIRDAATRSFPCMLSALPEYSLVPPQVPSASTSATFPLQSPRTDTTTSSDNNTLSLEDRSNKKRPLISPKVVIEEEDAAEWTDNSV
ncbi:unnamed protein product [Caenorhabditis sp. 36 PRJEB53466]|nr:unnamed protein product [Caenorhabditis sp. 36 PRJEB53466]